MKDSLFAVILGMILLAVMITGWVMNIISIIHSSGMSGILVARIIGVFMFPLGSVLGYF